MKVEMMKIIQLSARDWKTVAESHQAILSAVGAPKWNGLSIAAMTDALIWDGENSVSPPFTVMITDVENADSKVVDDLNELSHFVSAACIEYSRKKGQNLDISLQLLP